MRRIYFFCILFFLQIFCISDIAKAGNMSQDATISSDKKLLANLSGVIWFDQNINGMIDESEFPLSNIPVLLFTCNGQFINAVVSQSNGSFVFNNVPNGSYKIYVSFANAGNFFSFTIQNDFTDNHVNESGYSECIIANDGSFELNAGLTIFPIIGDRVWEDLNGNGLQNVDEPGIAGVTVEAFSDEILVASTTTNSEGNYFFNTLLPGNDYFRFLAPDAYISTKHLSQQAQNSKITQNNGSFTTDEFTIQAGGSNAAVAAGFYRCAKICGIIYEDINETDSLDINENGINGLRVNSWQIVNGDTLFYGLTHTSVKVEAPGDDGYYEFCVPPGIYFVEIDDQLLNNYLPGAPLMTDNPETFNHFFEIEYLLSSYTITLESNDSYCNINQGFYCAGKITSRVWRDTDQDGLQDIGESPLEDIVVQLLNEEGILVNTAVTDSLGLVTFERVRKGTNYLHYSIGSEFIFTNAFQGPQNIDSDFNVYLGPGTTPLHVLSDCATLLGINAGVSLKPLPLSWLNVYAESVSKDKNKINWEVAKEFNVSHYNLQKSFDGISWTSFGKVLAFGTHDKITYNDVDNEAGHNLSYYRIQSADYDGLTSFSEIVYVTRDHQKFQMMVTPNPANHLVDITIENWKEDEYVTITINNQMGQKVMELQNVTNHTFISLEHILDGVYYINVRSKGGYYRLRNSL